MRITKRQLRRIIREAQMLSPRDIYIPSKADYDEMNVRADNERDARKDRHPASSPPTDHPDRPSALDQYDDVEWDEEGLPYRFDKEGNYVDLAHLMEEGKIKISKRQLIRIVRESTQPYNFVAATKAALQADDLDEFARLMVDEYGQDAYLQLEDMKFDDPDFEDVRDLLRDPEIEDAVYDEQDNRLNTAIVSSPNKNELAALGDAFQAAVGDADVKYIVYQPRKKGGQVTAISLEDISDRLGNMSVTLRASDMKHFSTTLQAVMDVLNKGGAKLRKKRPPIKHVPPMYD